MNTIKFTFIFTGLFFLCLGCGPEKHSEKDNSTSPHQELQKKVEMQSAKLEAQGSEPFWSLRISGDSIHFSSITPGLKDISFTVKEIKDEGDTRLYSADTNHGGLEVIIRSKHRSCTSAGKGDVLNRTVLVQFHKNDGLKHEFSGCGNFTQN
ncbi:MAG: hypothetical protein HKN61_02005 [Flavobacteriaceae bacterium]|nr:hypothetical protein [Flavobacteriaceae bacterium]